MPDASTNLANSSLPWGLLGQDEQVQALARGVAEGRTAHAYLFAGPAQSGKATLARRLAQALNCTDLQPLPPDGVARCGLCRACRHIEADNHPDVETVAPGGLCDDSQHDHRKDNSRDIKICQVRALGQRLSISAFEGRCRVITIDPADALNAISADAFLKTLEEPPPGVVLLLLSAKEELLAETVRSRLRRVEVRPAPIARLEALLARRGMEPARAALTARLARGCTGWALAVAANAAVLDERGRRLDEIAALVTASLADRFAYAAALAGRWTKDRAGVGAELQLWQDWWRDIALGAAGAEGGILNVDRVEQIRAAAAEVTVAGAARFVQALRDARRHLDENANARLALEVLMLRMGAVGSGHQVAVERK